MADFAPRLWPGESVTSTIYLANEAQISDPDLIWPGQVFTVPENTPEGEPANMKAVGKQATTISIQ